jgi:hypothetical protein
MSAAAARDVDRPRPGYFKIRLTRGGVYVPARIYRCCTCTVNGGPDSDPHDWQDDCDRFPALVCDIDGSEGRSIGSLWAYGIEITRREYDHMVRVQSWERAYNPGGAHANARRPVDLNDLKPLF